MKDIYEKNHMNLIDFSETKRKEWMEKRKPFSVLFELTPKCNMKCIHCYLQNVHAKQELKYDEIVEIIDILYDKGILFLTFTGGEILTRRDFLDIYIYAKKRGFLVELFTNGYLINDEMIEIFKLYPPLLIDISLYGAKEDTYYEITGIHGAFERVIENAKKLNEAGIRVSLKSPIIQKTLYEIEDMKRIAEQIGVPFVYTFEICSTVDKSDKPLEQRVKLSEVLMHEFENYYEQNENGNQEEYTDDRRIIEELKSWKYVYACNVALNSFVIDYQGFMCPCMKLRHKGIRIKRDNYDAIWKKFEIYSKAVASDRYVCKHCNARYYCDICPAEMDFLYNDMEYRTEEDCKCAKIRRAFYEKELTFEEAINLASFDE